MTRSIGDFIFKMNLKSAKRDPATFALSNIPEIQELQFSQSQNSTNMILMCCDGIWDGTVFPKDDIPFENDSAFSGQS